MVKAVGPSIALKRAGETAQGLQATKLYLAQDDSALATPEYIRYKTNTEAAGKPALRPLRWHLSSELDQMDKGAQGPPSKRTRTTGVAGEHMQEDANV